MVRIVFTLGVMALALPAGAEVYRYQNEQGRWVFSDQKPDDDGYEEVEVRGKTARRNEPDVRQRRDGREVVPERGVRFMGQGKP